MSAFAGLCALGGFGGVRVGAAALAGLSAFALLPAAGLAAAFRTRRAALFALGARLAVLLRTALERKYGTAELMPLDDRTELLAHDEMCRRLGG